MQATTLRAACSASCLWIATALLITNANAATVTVQVGPGGSSMSYFPSSVTINVGDTVEWTSPSPTGFHNVLFGAEPEIFTFEPQPSGPPGPAREETTMTGNACQRPGCTGHYDADGYCDECGRKAPAGATGSGASSIAGPGSGASNGPATRS